jgi:3-oxoacyl-[acyl-carrier protein] reductase
MAMEAIRIPDLEGKAFLVTGASTGIGAAVARALGRQRAHVAVHYNRSEAEARAVAEDVAAAGAEAWTVGGDLSDPRVVEAIVAGTGERFSTPEQMAAMVAAVPTGTAADCVGAYLFLASDALSSYVTGQVLEVNGGQLMP